MIWTLHTREPASGDALGAQLEGRARDRGDLDEAASAQVASAIQAAVALAGGRRAHVSLKGSTHPALTDPITQQEAAAGMYPEPPRVVARVVVSVDVIADA
jgi:hypothetical protein